jgi:very-short-patch-repair endonuclease
MQKGERMSEELKKKLSLAHKGKPAWNKNIPMSEEARRKSRLSHKGLLIGRKVSEETKQKISLANKGKIHSAESIRRQSESLKKTQASPEARKRLSEAQKKVWLNPEYRKKASETKRLIFIGAGNPFYNKKHTAESREKNRLSHLGHRPSAETLKKLSLAQKGHSTSAETRRKIGESHKGMKHTAESLKKMSEAQKKTWSNLELRKRLSEGHKGKHYSPRTEFVKGKPLSAETRGKIKAIWNTPKYQQIAIERRSKQIFPMRDSTPEVKIQNFLRQLNLDFVAHKYMREIKHSYQCDILIPSFDLVIEVDGNYWHKYPYGTELDHIRTKELQEKGFKVLRLWESEIKKMNLNDFTDKIRRFK